ncbi:hypothetical protein EDC04DRAFT_2624992 [Pisolithus marmoratus]|nr:hypothetical protein EDC04DRAFT_2624992 [Pisolithus marmoratus]
MASSWSLSTGSFFEITISPNVDVEVQESVVTRSAGPKFLKSTYSSNPTIYVREPRGTGGKAGRGRKKEELLTTALAFDVCTRVSGGVFILSVAL